MASPVSGAQAPITFVVPGQRQVSRSGAPVSSASASGLPGQVKASVRVAARRGTGDAVRVSAVPGEDVPDAELGETERSQPVSSCV